MRAESFIFRSHFLFLAAFLAAGSSARAADNPYLNELKSKASQLNLAADPYWRLINRYQSTLFGLRSEIRNSDFFLSPHGRSDPAAELNASLDGFFQPVEGDGAAREYMRDGNRAVPAGKENDVAAWHARGTAGREDSSSRGDGHPICRFPARLAWLTERLGIERARLPRPECPHFERWKKDISADSVALIFASAYLDNPSSMYGHTFLRFNQKAHGSQEKLLDIVVNYAAEPNTENGILFAAYGMFGVFPGKYAAMPYYLKVQEYSNFDRRDLWEYSLDLNSGEITRLIDHIWELGRAEFPYYFFNKNCSYQLLALLDAARPSLHLTDRWPLYVIPFDTVRQIQRRRLITKRAYRPSQTTRLTAARRLLTPQETKIAAGLATGKPAAWDRLAALAPERKAPTLDIALDYLQYRNDFQKEKIEATGSLNRKMLIARSEIPLKSAPPEITAPPPPDAGHPTARAWAGYGYDGAPFLEAQIRPGLHDLLDPPEGYADGSELEMFNLALRHNLRDNRPYLQSLDLVRILSLAPLDPWFKKPSWMVDGGIRQAVETGHTLGRAGYAGLTAGAGVAAETHAFKKETLYLLAEADAGAGRIFDQNYRIGGGPVIGMNVEITRRWRGALEGAVLGYPLGDQRAYGRAKLTQQLDLWKNISLRVELRRYGQSKSVAANLIGYF